jgi:diacylglycerol kinase (ATP)
MQPRDAKPDSIERLARDRGLYRRASPRWQRAQSWTLSLVRSFGYAFAGIAHLFRRQRNAQVHLFVATVVCGASWAWGLSRTEWLIVVLTITIVMGMEAINTAIEAVVDLVSPQYHPLAKAAKDVAAGGVLLVAIGAAVIALLVYGARLLELARHIFM